MSEVTQVTLDQFGRVQTPEEIRIRLGMASGMQLAIEALTDEEIRLRPVRETPRLIDKGGILVVRSTPVEALTKALDDVARQEREDRVADLMRRIDV